MATSAWREKAEQVLERDVADFFAGGSGAEETLSGNDAAWAHLALRPRVLRDVSTVRCSTTVLDSPVAAPLLVAPVAYQRLLHDKGEAATAEGCSTAGSLMIVSSRSSVPVEVVAAAMAGRDWWLQVYVMRDRERSADLVRRAARLGCRALVLTGDTPYVATKPRDRANDFRLPREMLLNGSDEGAEQDPSTDLSAIGWLAALSQLPVVVKGVLRADDARACVDAGASALVVSNHGGRQLDGAMPTAHALSEVVESVAGEVEIYVDGGIRSGRDVLRAVALGADAALVGRPAAWALAAAGASGVATLLAELGDELREAMALAGASDLDGVTRDLVAPTPIR